MDSDKIHKVPIWFEELKDTKTLKTQELTDNERHYKTEIGNDKILNIQIHLNTKDSNTFLNTKVC